MKEREAILITFDDQRMKKNSGVEIEFLFIFLFF